MTTLTNIVWKTDSAFNEITHCPSVYQVNPNSGKFSGEYGLVETSASGRKKITLPSITSYLGSGYHLFPLHERTRPDWREWIKQATSDLVQLEEWEYEFPTCNWGIVTGPESGILAVRVDDEGWPCEEASETLTIRTEGSYFLLYRWPKGLKTRGGRQLLTPKGYLYAEGCYVEYSPATDSCDSSVNSLMSDASASEVPEWLLNSGLFAPVYEEEV